MQEEMALHLIPTEMHTLQPVLSSRRCRSCNDRMCRALSQQFTAVVCALDHFERHESVARLTSPRPNRTDRMANSSPSMMGESNLIYRSCHRVEQRRGMVPLAPPRRGLGVAPDLLEAAVYTLRQVFRKTTPYSHASQRPSEMRTRRSSAGICKVQGWELEGGAEARRGLNQAQLEGETRPPRPPKLEHSRWLGQESCRLLTIARSRRNDLGH